MENKTSYTQAKDEISQGMGYSNFALFADQCQPDEVNDFIDAITEELRKENETLKIQASNYAYQMDMAKRERDKAEESNNEVRRHKINLQKENEELRQRLIDAGIVMPPIFIDYSHNA